MHLVTARREHILCDLLPHSFAWLGNGSESIQFYSHTLCLFSSDTHSVGIYGVDAFVALPFPYTNFFPFLSFFFFSGWPLPPMTWALFPLCGTALPHLGFLLMWRALSVLWEFL